MTRTLQSGDIDPAFDDDDEAGSEAAEAEDEAEKELQVTDAADVSISRQAQQQFQRFLSGSKMPERSGFRSPDLREK